MSLHHHEHHNASSASLRDFVLGMADGLTVPFALAAGLSGAVESTGLIVTAGIAEIAAGAIAMGLGGYLGAKTEKQHYDSEYAREMHEVKHLPKVEAKEVADILTDFGVPDKELPVVVEAICQHPEKWVEFMMRFELGLERPDPRRILRSPLIIGGAYVTGGLVPLVPYMLVAQVPLALGVSAGVSVLALVAFGAFKGYCTGQNMKTSAVQTALVGSLAAAVAFTLAKLVT